MKYRKNSLITKLALVALVSISILVIIKYLPWIIEMTVSPEKFRRYIISLNNWGIVTFLSFQALQTIIAPIPGEVIQIAGGYVYGGILGTVYSMLGMMIGAVSIFYLTRFISFTFVEKMLKHKSTQWLMKLTNNKNFSIIMFLMFIIPGLPKDVLIYIAALTSIKPSKFFLILLAGRLPCTATTVFIGSNVYQGNYIVTTALIVLSVLVVAIGMLYKNKIINLFTKQDVNNSQ